MLGRAATSVTALPSTSHAFSTTRHAGSSSPLVAAAIAASSSRSPGAAPRAWRAVDVGEQFVAGTLPVVHQPAADQEERVRTGQAHDRHGADGRRPVLVVRAAPRRHVLDPYRGHRRRGCQLLQRLRQEGDPGLQSLDPAQVVVRRLRATAGRPAG